MFICISISRKTDWCPSVPLYFQCIEVSLEEKLEGSIAPMIEQNFQCITGYADLGVLWQWLMKCTVDNATNAFGYHFKFHPLPHEIPDSPFTYFRRSVLAKSILDTCYAMNWGRKVSSSPFGHCWFSLQISQPSKTLDNLIFLGVIFFIKIWIAT